MKLVNQIAATICAIENCKKGKLPINEEWEGKHIAYLGRLIKNKLPSGAGFDNGTTLALDKSTPEKLDFVPSYG